MDGIIKQETNVFNFDGNNIRVVMIDEEPWFVGKDVTEVLGYKDALVNHVDDEDTKILTSDNTTLENLPNRGMTGINESGMYSLILSSKLPNAKRFKKWVTGEVLPQIRKTGKYNIKPQFQLPDFTNPAEAAIAWAEQWKRIFTSTYI